MMRLDSSSCSTMKANGLPEDVMFEIFLRLPWKSVNKFKYVSKLWLSIISDPFLRKKFKTLVNKLKPWAIFSNHVIPQQHQPFDIIIPRKLSHTEFMSSCNELSVYDGFSFSFLIEPYRLDAQNHMLYVLASSSGLALCAVVSYAKGSRRYFVCNPITNKSVSLRLPSRKGVGKFLHGLVCETFSFKVMRTRTALENITDFEVEIYFSDMDEWRTYNVAYLQSPRHYVGEYGSKHNVITNNGIVYWLEGYPSRVVSYDLKINNYECGSHHCHALDGPKKISDKSYSSSSECLGVSENYVCYGQIQKNFLRTWELMENNNSFEKSVWNLRYKIELPNFDSGKISVMSFSPVDRDVVILDCGKQILPFDGTSEKSEILERLCVPSIKNSFNLKNQHGYSPVIIQPTLTTIPKER